MAECEICGRSGRTYKVKIEGTILSVCKFCASLGEPVKIPTPRGKLEKRTHEPVKYEEVELVPDYAEKIREGMKKRNYEAKILAKLLMVKRSYLERVIAGKTKPDKKTAKKLQYALRIHIINEPEKVKKRQKKQEKPKKTMPEKEKKSRKVEPLTIGDIVQIKMKNKK
ncbi:MAG: TIGR00270 family protein [Candidatus Aenigmarchaeota archaeon]|nr:TIGR00270 family protein [Candidatus Aenigmarchaeota archaeon]